MAQISPEQIAEFLRFAETRIFAQAAEDAFVFGTGFAGGPRYRDAFYTRDTSSRSFSPIADGKRTIRMNRYSSGPGGAGYGARAIDLPKSEWRWL